MVQLTNISGIRVLHQEITRRFLESGQSFPVPFRMLPEKTVREEHDVFTPFPQRRQRDLDRVQTKKEVLTETARGDFLVRVRIRGRNDPHIRVQCFRRTNALELSGLNHAQQFCLLIHWHIGDFVHEKRALIGQLEAAGAICFRIGERALHMAK